MVLEFRCGKCKLGSNGTTVTADPRKGKLCVSKTSEDGLTHLTWTDRTQGLVEDDFIIFPGDASFVYVDAAKENAKNNRVYSLKFTSTKKVHFFWMQEPKADKDEDLSSKVHAFINGDDSADDSAPGNIGQMDQAQILAMLTQARGQRGLEAEGAGAEESATGGDAAADAAATEEKAGGGDDAEGGGSAAEGGDAGGGDKMDTEGEAKP